MPKALAKFSVRARNLSTGLSERISPSKDIRTKYAEVGKRRPVPKAKHVKVVPPKLTLLERIQIDDEFNKEMADKRLIAKLVRQKRVLELDAAAAQAIAGLSLEDRLDPRGPFEPGPPFDSTLRFHKIGILRRIEEFRPIFEATFKRLDPVFNALNKEDDRETATSIPSKIPEVICTELWTWWGNVQELYDHLGEEGHNLSLKEWRECKGALKRIRKVKLENPSDNLLEISVALWDLNLTFPTYH